MFTRWGPLIPNFGVSGQASMKRYKIVDKMLEQLMQLYIEQMSQVERERISGWIKILSGRLVAEFGRGTDKSNRDALAPKRDSKRAFERGSRIWAVEKTVDKLNQELLSDYLKLELKDQTIGCVLV